jgi:hypothetical protein
MQLWHEVILIPSSIANKMQSKATCGIGWTWRQLMLLCRSLYVSLKKIQWTGLPSSTFGETCETEGYLCSIDSFFLVTNQNYILITQNINFSKILCNAEWR